MTKTITCDKCNGRGYFTFEQSGPDYAGVTVLRCEVCQGKGMVEVPVTNADRIRAMSDEEMLDFIDCHCIESPCEIICGGECRAFHTLTKTSRQRCREIILDWLKQPYGGADHE